MTTHLLIDNSNSFTKFGLADDSGLKEVKRIPTPLLSHESLADLSARWTFDEVTVCSVVPRIRNLLLEFFAPKNPRRVTPAAQLGFAIDYPTPNGIGEDRLANAAWLVAEKRSPAIVIDFGTAVTFDVVDDRPAYIGGIIAPGLRAMTDYLHECTAQLPRVSLTERPPVLGKTTEEAMQSGAFHGYRGLIRGILAPLCDHMKTKQLSVFATGGYADLITAEMPEITAIVPDLTLLGILAVARLNPLR